MVIVEAAAEWTQAAVQSAWLVSGFNRADTHSAEEVGIRERLNRNEREEERVTTIPYHLVVLKTTVTQQTTVPSGSSEGVAAAPHSAAQREVPLVNLHPARRKIRYQKKKNNSLS